MKKSKLLATVLPYFTFILILCFAFSCQQPVEDGITEEEAKALLEKVLTVYNEGNLSAIDECTAPDYMLHFADNPENIVGIDAFKAYITNLRNEFPDFKTTINETLVKGDKIVILWTVTGTNTGPIGEMPPTGKAIHIEGVSVNTVVDGKFTRALQYNDGVALLTQLGYSIMPPTFEVEEAPTGGEVE